jgi:MipA family protein
MRLQHWLCGLGLLIIPIAASSHVLADDHASNSGAINLQTGGFVAVAPKYEGSKDYEVRGFPIIAPSGDGLPGSGRVQFRGPDDLRFRLFDFNGFEMGPLAGWRFDREESDAQRLRGLGDVDGGFVVGGYVAYRAGRFTPFVSYHRQVSGDDTGGLVRFGAEADVITDAAFSLRATLGASYADDEFMDAYFTVSRAQQAASVAGLQAYEAEAGIKDVFLGFNSDVPLSDSWTLKLSGRYSRLIGDAADSPIVEDENQFFGGLGLTYRFSFQR